MLFIFAPGNRPGTVFCLMNIVIFGSGPMPCEARFPVMAPGARTWQIVQTVVRALPDGGEPHRVVVLGLEPTPRAAGDAAPVVLPWSSGAEGSELVYVPLTYDDFVAAATSGRTKDLVFPESPDAVVGCASLQPCATAADYAAAHRAPVWMDLFGDAITEVQSKAELHPDRREENDRMYFHVWRLLLRVLYHGDRFSALSDRQREAVIGQLGPAGRLGRRTRGEHLVHTIPFGIFPEDVPEPDVTEGGEERDLFTVMWCGSFNTWMDVDALVQGVAQALGEEPRLRLLVVGGRIAGYNDESFERFSSGIQAAGVEESVELRDWCSLEETRHLYARCDVGLSIDRYTYEAVLGSRTRIVNFLAAGKPVLSTVITELTVELSREGYVLPFRAGDGPDLARALVEAARMGSAGAKDLGRRGREFVVKRYSGSEVGRPLAEWIAAPAFARDKSAEGKHYEDNPLTSFWEGVEKLEPVQS